MARLAGTIAPKTLARAIESLAGVGFGNGRRITGPAVGAPTTLEVAGPSLIRWNQFGNPFAFPTSYVRVTWDGPGSLPTSAERCAFRTIGPYLWLPARGRYILANTSDGAFWVGTETITGTLYERVPSTLAFFLTKCIYPGVNRPTSPSPAGGFSVFAFPAGASRNYLFRLSGAILSNLLEVTPFNIAFGSTNAGATFGHPISPGGTLIIPRGQIAGIGATSNTPGQLIHNCRYQ